MANILICDKLEAVGIQRLEQMGIQVDNRPGLTGEQLVSALQNADAAIVRSGTRITASLLENPGKLRAIARAGVGVDNIDVPAATRKGIVVMNTPGGNTISAAEHTIALLLSLARHIPAADAGMKQGKWERNRYLGTQITGKTLGIIGLGRIGREVATRAAGLQMKVIGYDPFMSPDRVNQLGITGFSKLSDMLPHCDFLTVHVPMTEQTNGLIGEKELKTLPNHCRILNVARGGIIDESALIEALNTGRIAGAALDVFTHEPLPGTDPLIGTKNLVLTPHLGASTAEAQEAVALEAADLLIDFLQKGIVQCAVNMSSIQRTELEEIRYFIDLARRLGLLQAQLADGPIQRAELHYRGDLYKKNTKMLTAAFAAGLLEHSLHESVNIVNAEMLAKERGIEIVESGNVHKGDFANLMHTEVYSSSGSKRAAATLFGNQYIRLVQLDDFRLESYLDGTLLTFVHQDVPGLIGYVGTIFGKNNVNIASMNLGRQTPGGEAVAVLNLDCLPPESALQEVKKHEKIRSLQVLKLPPSGELPFWLA